MSQCHNIDGHWSIPALCIHNHKSKITSLWLEAERKDESGSREERMSYSRRDWVKPGWRCASSSPPPLSLPETRWSLGSLPPIRATGETEQEHLRSSPSDMGSSLYGSSKTDGDGTITKDEARRVQSRWVWTEASVSSSIMHLLTLFSYAVENHITRK